ncbi:MAG: tetratricopeptide repeat protein, partial [Promethearchaeota archaeon]
MTDQPVIKGEKPEELSKANNLIDEGKLDEALTLLSNYEQKEALNHHDKASCRLLQCKILFWQGKYKELIKLAEQIYKESRGVENIFLKVDSLLIMTHALAMLDRIAEALDLIKQGEELIKTIPQKLTKTYKQREAYLAFIEGYLCSRRRGRKLKDQDLALEYLEHSLAVREELGIKHEIAEVLGEMAWTRLITGELNRALKYAERSLALAKESRKKYYIASSFKFLGQILGAKGELDQGIRNYEQSLVLFKELNNKDRLAWVLNNVSRAYRIGGEFERALECIEQSMALNRECGKLRMLADNHDYLIQILIDKGDLKRAQISLNDLEQIKNQLKDENINLLYLYDKALVLKTSLRARDRGKAEEILTQLLEDDDLDFEGKYTVLLNLCDLLLTELRITNDQGVLDELTQFLGQLLDLAEKSDSYWIIGETYLLQAKLALISLDLKEARRLLTQGQQIAEKFGLDMLARKISNDHDELLKKLITWENLKDSDISLEERMELARLNEQMDDMLQKRVTEPDEIQDEESVVILIISKGGNPIFSQSFTEGWSFKDHLFGGFLSAVNSFSDEMFSQGLDRAIFGKYTIIMNAIPPFIVCYLFK